MTHASSRFSVMWQIRDGFVGVLGYFSIDNWRRGFLKQARIHHIYFLLAAFDVLAVGGGLYLNHKVTTNFARSILENQSWSSYTNNLGVLAELAQEVNAPGHDVFGSQDVGRERMRQDASLKLFSAKLLVVSKSLQNVDSPALRDALASIHVAVAEMVSESRSIFNHIEAGQSGLAAERMTAMDRKYAALTKALTEATGAVQDLQATQLIGQMREVGAYERIEYVMAAMILLMVALVAVFGHRMARSIRRAHDGRSLALSQVQAINENITNLNVELANSILKLKEAQEEIVRKGRMAQLGQLTATVAHEIRNPLGAIKTSAQLVERKIRGKDLGLDKAMERINKGIVRCDTIISELLDFARSKSLAVEPLTLDDWVRATIEEEIANLPAAVRVDCKLDLRHARVDFDPDQMRRVLVNLLSNAAEAMVGKGSVKVAAATIDPRIEVRTRLVGGAVEIAVADNGPGMAPDTLARIREPLFTTKSFGVGLGIPAVEKVLEAHGGGLRIESRPGEGSVFTAWFPRQPGQAKAA